jgi:hypothetical protein
MRHLFTTFVLASVLTMSAVAANAQAPATNGKFCLTPVRAGSAKNCSFTTMAACQKAKTGEGDDCSANAATTGSGMSDVKTTAPSATPAQNNSPKDVNTGK